MEAKLILTAAVAVSAMLILWYLNGTLVTPVRGGKNIRLRICVSAHGCAPELEHTVDGLLWLIDNGTLPSEIVICDEGMDDETRLAARMLAGDDERIHFEENWGRHGPGERAD